MNGTNLRIALKSGNALAINLTNTATQQIRMVSPSAGSFSGKISVDTTFNWNQKTAYVPIKGEIVIYSDRNVVENVNYPGIKIGDGLAYVVDLPFFMDDEVSRLIDLLTTHINNTDIHITVEERAFWNAKLNYEISDETLTFTRN